MADKYQEIFKIVDHLNKYYPELEVEPRHEVNFQNSGQDLICVHVAYENSKTISRWVLFHMNDCLGFTIGIDFGKAISKGEEK